MKVNKNYIMNIIKAIQTAERKQKERGYKFLYWCIDVHGVILSHTNTLHNTGAEFYPYCLATLGLLTDNPKYKLILWTSSLDIAIQGIYDTLAKEDINFHYVNENPDFTVTGICDYTKKFHFDILLEDKAGFEAETDWKVIYDYLKRKAE